MPSKSLLNLVTRGSACASALNGVLRNEPILLHSTGLSLSAVCSVDQHPAAFGMNTSARRFGESIYELSYRRLHHQLTYSPPMQIAAPNRPRLVYPSDVFVDGYVSNTFPPEDATHYFTLLLKAPPSASLIHMYGIVCSGREWHITQNLQFVQHPAPNTAGVPSRLLLDYHTGNIGGTVVRQRRWLPRNEVDVRRHIEDATLQLPVFFVARDGTLGYGLQSILQNAEYHLRDGYQPAPLGGVTTTTIRIGWPGYQDWKRQIQARDETSERRQITLARFMKYIGTSVDRFFKDSGVDHPAGSSSGIGIGGITQRDVRIIGAVHVSAGSWMPIIQLTKYVF
ncbi:hypothetical protein BC834DRAFT_900958 [Gloeopeniophorella convolvens]|nr:hypothetical protein BC834DRAFT_900958 [Gloeopeniophorella convolvens]